MAYTPQIVPRDLILGSDVLPEQKLVVCVVLQALADARQGSLDAHAWLTSYGAGVLRHCLPLDVDAGAVLARLAA